MQRFPTFYSLVTTFIRKQHLVSHVRTKKTHNVVHTLFLHVRLLFCLAYAYRRMGLKAAVGYRSAMYIPRLQNIHINSVLCSSNCQEHRDPAELPRRRRDFGGQTSRAEELIVLFSPSLLCFTFSYIKEESRSGYFCCHILYEHRGESGRPGFGESTTQLHPILLSGSEMFTGHEMPARYTARSISRTS